MKKVLIVEDDRWLAELFASSLQKAGYKTETASHAYAAIDVVDTFHPDVIMLDMLLTGSTGFALLNELQSHADTMHVPVIVCSNLAENVDSEQLKQYGVLRMIDKTTMVPDDVVTAVRAVLA